MTSISFTEREKQQQQQSTISLRLRSALITTLIMFLETDQSLPVNKPNQNSHSLPVEGVIKNSELAHMDTNITRSNVPVTGPITDEVQPSILPSLQFQDPVVTTPLIQVSTYSIVSVYSRKF